MGISFAHPWFLLLLVPALSGAFLLWRQMQHRLTGRRGGTILCLRFLLLASIVMALGAPAFRHTIDRQAVVFVADLSYSVAGDREKVEAFIRQAMQARDADDLAGVVVVGQDALVEWPVSARSGFYSIQSVVNADYTNLAEGLQLAGALLPQDAERRIVLLSDGRQNIGEALEEAHFLDARHIRVDVVPLEGFYGPESLVAAVNAPSTARLGEQVLVEVLVEATSSADASLELSMDGAKVIQQRVTLEPGESRFAFDIPIQSPGFHTFRASLDSNADTVLQNNLAEAFIDVHGPPRVLVVEEHRDASRNLVRAFETTGIEVEVRQAFLLPESLEEMAQYAAIVLVDVSAGALEHEKMELIESVVRDLGRGLLVVGGAHSFTVGGYRNTDLEKVLPVTAEVPEQKEKGQIALVLVIDKSGTMATLGRDGLAKIDMAKEAARDALAELKTYDLAGVVAFDAMSWWLVPLDEVGHEAHLKEMQESIGSLVADGGTDMYAGLVAAHQAVANAPASRRHIILLTDGRTQPGDYDGLLAAMEDRNVTLSTIAVGGDADTTFLDWLAEQGGGRFYFTDRSGAIPQIVIEETRMAARQAIIEEAVVPLVVGDNPFLRITGTTFPLLEGYVVTTPKNAAQVDVVSPQGDPLLAHWQYGLGRVVAWTSDSQGRWTSPLNYWERAARFWSALVDWTLPPEQAPFQVEASASEGMGHLIVEGQTNDEARITARVVNPELGSFEVQLKAFAPGRYEGQFLAEDPGSYLVQVSEHGPDGQRRAAMGGLVVPYSPEYRDLQGGSDLLERVAAITGGGALVAPAEAFGSGLSPAYGDVPFASWLFVGAAFLLLLDIALRRINVGLPEVISRLSEARKRMSTPPVSPHPEATSQLLDRVRNRRARHSRSE